MTQDAGPEDPQEMIFQYIPLDKLEISPSNVRRRERIADIDGLAHSMRTDGLQQPIIVQSQNGRYEIIIGQRRFLAARQLGWSQIAAFIKQKRLTEFEAKVISFSENIQRRELAPRDKADTCTYLLETLRSVEAVAVRLGITVQTVRKWLGYAGVHEGLKRLVDERKITVPLAIRLAEYVPDEGKAVAIAERIAQEKPPARQRGRILAAVEEAPDRPVDTIFRIAEEKRHEKIITFVLPAKWALAMSRAEAGLLTNASEIARDATVDWLESHRY